MMNNAARVINVFGDDNVHVVKQAEVIDLPISKPVHYGKQRGQKSEVFAYELADMAKILGYFKSNEKWLHYLLFAIQVNSARRIGDLIGYLDKETGKRSNGLVWADFFNTTTGKMRNEIRSFAEQKTGKLASPMINQAMRDAIYLYCEKTGCDPDENNYQNPVFLQLSGTHKRSILSYEGALKALKTAAAACGIEYNVGTHSGRKAFGATTKLLHQGDANVMEALQGIYNHSSSAITNRYIGLTKKQTDGYAQDFSDAFTKYAVNGEEIPMELGTPVIAVNTDQLLDLIGAAFQAGKESDGTNDAAILMNLMKQIEKIRK